MHYEQQQHLPVDIKINSCFCVVCVITPCTFECSNLHGQNMLHGSDRLEGLYKCAHCAAVFPLSVYRATLYIID